MHVMVEILEDRRNQAFSDNVKHWLNSNIEQEWLNRKNREEKPNARYCKVLRNFDKNVF